MAFTTNNTVIARVAAGLYGLQLGSATMNVAVNEALALAVQDDSPNVGISRLMNVLYQRDFASQTDAAVAATLVSNLGITDPAHITEAKAIVEAALGGAAAGAKGAVIVDLVNQFSGLTANPFYGAYATAFNKQIDRAVLYAADAGNPDVPVSSVVPAFRIESETAAGASVMHLTGNQDVRIDFSNSANQVRGLDLDGDGTIANDGVENRITGKAANFAIVDAYPRNPFNHGDSANNFLGDISFDGTGFNGDGTTTDGNIFLGGLGGDIAFGGIGNDFLAGGGVGDRAGRGDSLSGGRNADFFFAELSQLDSTDGRNTSFDGGSTADDTSAGNGTSTQDSDWILPELSDDDEPGSINLNGGFNALTTASGARANLDDIENVNASGNLYGFLDDVDVVIGGRATDDRATAHKVGTENFGFGSSAQLNITGSDEANIIIAGYDNDNVEAGEGGDLLFGGDLGYLLEHANNPNLVSSTGGLTLNANKAGLVNDGQDALDGGLDDDNIHFEMDGGSITGGTDNGTTGAGDRSEEIADNGDTLWLTDFSMGRLVGAKFADEADGTAAAQAAALAAATDGAVRIDLGNSDAAVFKNYGGSNAPSQDQNNYKTGLTVNAVSGMQSVIATGLGGIDYNAAGTNDPELKFNNVQNYHGIDANLDLRGDGSDNILFANTGSDVVEGRTGDDLLSGGTSNDTFVIQAGDGVDAILRQKDVNGDNIWDGTYGQDFRAPQVGDVDASSLIVNFGTTTIGSADVKITSFQLKIGTTTFAVADSTALQDATNITNLASIVNDAFKAIDSHVKVTANGNSLVVVDSEGRNISDTVAEGYLVSGVVSNGTLQANATFTPSGGVVNEVEDDILIIKTYADRTINLGRNEVQNEITNAADFVTYFNRDAAGKITDSVLAEGQDVAIRLVDVREGDKVTVTINGKAYSYTLTAGQDAEAAAAALVDVVNNELDLDSASGTVGAANGTPDAANFPDDLAAPADPANAAVFHVTQTPVAGSQTYMKVSVAITNALTGQPSGSAEMHNNSSTHLELVGFNGTNGNYNEHTVQFIGRSGSSTVSALHSAKDAGEAITGKDATDDTNDTLSWINGDDLLLGGDGNDTINGGTGDDRILVSKGTDTVDGGGNVNETTANGLVEVEFEDVLQAEESTFGTNSRFVVALSSKLGDNGVGTLTAADSANKAVGTTSFSEIETVRVLENSRESSLDVQALSNSIATAVGSNVQTGTEGLVINLTRTSPSVEYTVDVNDDGDVTDAADFDAFVATKVFGTEHLTGGNANETVNVDGSQASANNKIDLGADQDNTTTLVEGADIVVYDHSQAPLLDVAKNRPTITVVAEKTADVDLVAMTGGVLGTTTTTDTLTGVEEIDVTDAALGSTDTLDLSNIAGAVVNYGGAASAWKTMGGELTADSVANVEANTFEAGGVSRAGSGYGNELLELGTGIVNLERVTGSTAGDRVILGDAMLANTALKFEGDPVPTLETKIGFATYLGNANVTISNKELYRFDLGDGNDSLDYFNATNDVAVSVDTSAVAGTPTSVDYVLYDAAGNDDRLDRATNVENYYGGQGTNIIDLARSTVDTTIQFSQASDAGSNEPLDPNGKNDAADVDEVRVTQVRDTVANTVFATFTDRTATNATGPAFWTTVQGNSKVQTVLMTDNEVGVAHTLILGAGADVVDYSARTAAVTAEVKPVNAATNLQDVDVDGDTVTVTAAYFDVDGKTLTVRGSDQTGDTVDITALTNNTDSYNLVDLAAGVVVEDVKSTVAAEEQGNVIHVSAFENITGSADIDRLYGSGGVNGIDGGAGNDWLIGRGGQSVTGGDQLTGGLGSDRFIFEAETDSPTLTINAQDTIVDFATGADLVVFNTKDTGAVKLGALGTAVGVGAQVTVDIDQNGDGALAQPADDEYTINDTAGTIVATDVLLRVSQSTGQDLQHLNNQIGAADGQYEVVYTAANQSNNLALPDEFHAVELDVGNLSTSADKFDLRSFNFGAIKTGDTGNGDAGAADSDRNENGVADRIEQIIFTTPATVNSLVSVSNFFRDGAVATGTARAVHVQLESGTDNMRVFVDVDGDGSYAQASDLVFDLRDVINAGAAIGGVAVATDLYDDADADAADGADNGIFIFTDLQYNLWF